MVIKFWWMVIKVRSKLVETITSKHFLAINSWYVKLQMIWMNCHRHQQQIGRNNYLQALYHTLQTKPSQKCKRVWKRKKDGLALCSHFSGSGQLCVSFLVAVKISMKLYPPPPPKKKKLIWWQFIEWNSMNGHFSACDILPLYSPLKIVCLLIRCSSDTNLSADWHVADGHIHCGAV